MRAMASQHSRREGDEVNEFIADALSDDYDHVIAVASEWVSVYCRPQHHANHPLRQDHGVRGPAEKERLGEGEGQE